MPLGSLERALRTDFPVHGRPHTFSLPTIYKVLPITNKEWTKSSGRNSDHHNKCKESKKQTGWMLQNNLTKKFVYALWIGSKLVFFLDTNVVNSLPVEESCQERTQWEKTTRGNFPIVQFWWKPALKGAPKSPLTLQHQQNSLIEKLFKCFSEISLFVC